MDDGNGTQEHYWLSVSDLMSGLMIVFLFVAVTYMTYVSRERERIAQVAIAWNESQRRLYDTLVVTFADDLPRWNAEVDSISLAVRFKEPDVLFAAGSAEVRPAFKAILQSFFPRYAAIVHSFGEDVAEVRIEGHTSSEGPSANPYFFNMELSQNRTRAVLAYSLDSTGVTDSTRLWMRGRLTANGLSSSKVIRAANGEEDKDRSRRVEFRVRTNAEQRIVRILEMSQ